MCVTLLGNLNLTAVSSVKMENSPVCCEGLLATTIAKSSQFWWLWQEWKGVRRATKFFQWCRTSLSCSLQWAVLLSWQRERELIPVTCGPAQRLITDSIYRNGGRGRRGRWGNFWERILLDAKLIYAPGVQDELSIVLNRFPGNA